MKLFYEFYVFLRTMIFGVYMVISLIISLFFLLGVQLFAKNKWLSADRVAKIWAKSLLFVAGVTVQVKGAPISEETTFYVGNHTSLFDVVIAISVLPSPKAYVSKIENGRVPALNWWMKALGCVFIDRDNLRQQVKVLKVAEENMKKGLSYLVFPEGTRSKDGSVLEFKAGAFKIAQRAGVSVQPIGFVGVRKVLRKGSIKVYPSKIALNFGDVMRAEDFPKDTKEVAEQMRAEVARLADVAISKVEKL